MGMQTVHNDMVYVSPLGDGELHTHSQVEDYMMRGVRLESINILEFFVGTYEEDIGKEISLSGCRGCPRNGRVPYLDAYWKAKKKFACNVRMAIGTCPTL